MVEFYIVFFLLVIGSEYPIANADDRYENVLEELKIIKREIEIYRNTTTQLLKQNKIMRDELGKIHGNNRIQMDKNVDKIQKRSKRAVRTCQTQSPVAFTAYLDRHLYHLGIDQPIVYNRVLLNKGLAYNVHNGMFTVPKSGVYIFSWSCAARRIGSGFDIWVSLVVNSSLQTTASAQSNVAYDDNQGSSTAIIHVKKGDVVWTKRLYPSDAEIDSETERRVSSFTGALLFPDDAQTC